MLLNDVGPLLIAVQFISVVSYPLQSTQVSGTVNQRGTTLITFDMEFTCVIFNRNSVV